MATATNKTATRNWTTVETNLFCSILVDPVNSFMVTLEKRALKKTSTKDIFEQILLELKKRFKVEPYKTRNKEALSSRKNNAELELDVKKLQVKYNNIKQQWRKIIRDTQKQGSDLAAEPSSNNPDWFEIVNPVLASSLDEAKRNPICCPPEDTMSLYETNYESVSPKIEEDSPSSTWPEELNDGEDPLEDEMILVIPTEDIEEHPTNQSTNVLNTTEETSITSDLSENCSNGAVLKRTKTSPNNTPRAVKKRKVARSQLRAISQLASAVNKLADVNAKRMRCEEKDRQALLDFRKEEAEKNRRHEKEMAELYFRMIQIHRQPVAL